MCRLCLKIVPLLSVYIINIIYLQYNVTYVSVEYTSWDVPTPSLPSHGTLGWDGQWECRHGEQYRLGCSQSVPSFPRYIGMGWTVGIQAWGAVQVGMFPVRPFLPTVHWDGMDGGNTGMGSGTGWDVPSPSLPSHGTLGWDGRWEYRHGEWCRLGYSHSVPSFPRYIGMGWTVGIQAWGVVQVGMFPVRPFLPTVHWDGMDSGNTGMGSGAGWDVPTPSLPSHGTLGWDGRWEYRHGEWCRLGCSHSVPSFPWYIGMGWTVRQIGMFLLDGQLGCTCMYMYTCIPAHHKAFLWYNATGYQSTVGRL